MLFKIMLLLSVVIAVPMFRVPTSGMERQGAEKLAEAGPKVVSLGMIAIDPTPMFVSKPASEFLFQQLGHYRMPKLPELSRAKAAIDYHIKTLDNQVGNLMM